MQKELKEFFLSEIPFSLIVITLIAGALRFYGLGEKSLWFDEIHSLHLETTAKNIFSIPSLLTKYYLSDPPLFHILQYITLLVGQNEFWIRFSSCVAGIVTIPIFYNFVNTVTKSKNLSITAASLLSISPFHIYYSQEARSYSLFLLFGILTFHFLFLGIQKPENKKYWFFYGIFIYLSLLTHYLSIFVVICQTIIFCIFLIKKLLEKKKDEINCILIPFFITQIIVSTVFYLSWYPFMAKQKAMATYLDISSSPLSLKTVFSNVLQVLGVTTFAVPILFILFLGLFLFLINKKTRFYFMIFLCWITFPIISEYIYITTILKSFFHPRYIIIVLPALLCVFSYSVVYIYRKIVVLPNRSHFIFYIFFIIIAYPFLNGLFYYYQQDKMPWKGVSAYLKSKTENNDIIVTSPNFFLPPLLYYFSPEKDYLLSNSTIISMKNKKIHFGHLNAFSNIEELDQKVGIWCITNKNFAAECESHMFKLNKNFDGIISSVLIYGNKTVLNRF